MVPDMSKNELKFIKIGQLQGWFVVEPYKIGKIWFDIRKVQILLIPDWCGQFSRISTPSPSKLSSKLANFSTTSIFMRLWQVNDFSTFNYSLNFHLIHIKLYIFIWMSEFFYKLMADKKFFSAKKILITPNQVFNPTAYLSSSLSKNMYFTQKI